jgi:hypothetical protein
VSEDRAPYTLQKSNTTATASAIEAFKTQPRPVAPTDIAQQRHDELKALLTDIKELLADHAREHERFMGDHT